MIQESRQPNHPLGSLPIEVACAVLGVNRGSYYRADLLTPLRGDLYLNESPRNAGVFPRNEPRAEVFLSLPTKKERRRRSPRWGTHDHSPAALSACW